MSAVTFDERAYLAEVYRHYGWNFAVNMLDVIFYFFGIGFISVTTILPLYVGRLTDSRLLIGLVAAIAQAGWFLPQLFTANYVERLPRKKPVVINIGFFSERIPFILMTGSAFFFAGRNPPLALVLFFLGFVWQNFGAGIVATSWQDMLAKVFPVDRRGRFFGLSTFAGTGMGVLGATLATVILDRFDFPNNYALCFLLASVGIFLSWAFLALTREPAMPSNKEPISQREYWRRLPSVLRADPNFSRFILNRIISGLGRMGVGFVTVYAVGRWDLPDSQAGLYTAVLLISQSLLNLVFGFLADWRGHKVVLELGAVAAALAMLTGWLAPSPIWLYLAFGCMGAAFAAEFLSGIMIVLEFAGPDDRPTYVGLVNTTLGIFSGISPLIGGWLAGSAGYPTLFASAFALTAVAFVILRWRVEEPRWTSKAAAS